VLVLVLTAPTLTRLTSVGRLDTNDGRFSIWNVAWIGHALTTDPVRLFDANIFWPHRGTLAYSELNLVAGVLGLPWYVATGSPLAALNGAIATALVIAFVSMWALVRRLTGSDGAGLVAAGAFTFCPYTSSLTAHVQLLMVFVFPLVLLAFHHMAERPGWRRGTVLGAALAVAALACGYFGIFAGCALGLMAVALAGRSRAYWVGLATALLTAGTIVYPVFRAFREARAASGATFAGHEHELPAWSANVSSYLASGAVAHAWWLPWLREWQVWVDPLFPGLAVLALAGVAIAATRWTSGSRRTVYSYLILAGTACWASFGPDAGLYALLEAVVPGMSLLRAPARVGIVVTFALAVIAGFGVAVLERRRRWLPAVLILVVAAELSVRTDEWGWPSWPLRTRLPLSAAYQRLAELPRHPLVEYPFPYVSSNFHNHAHAMFWSTYHWQPLVNGYSDVIPPDFAALARPINGFPDPASFAIMKGRGVRYVLWHIDTYDAPSRRVLEERLEAYASYLRPLVQTDTDWLYEIVDWP
jgi:hypothetical protein